MRLNFERVERENRGLLKMAEFYFKTKLDQTILLGIRARNIQGLLEGLRNVPDSSIYYHTHRFLQQHHYLSPEPPNDFAYWVTEIIGDDVLGERLASVDIVQFSTIAELRDRFITILEHHLETVERLTFAPAGHEFHFMANRTFVLPTAFVAHSLGEFQEILGRVSINSLYFHIFDARLRLGRNENDFSLWFRSLGHVELADAVKTLDPYTYSMEGLRKRLSVLVRRYDTH